MLSLAKVAENQMLLIYIWGYGDLKHPDNLPFWNVLQREREGCACVWCVCVCVGGVWGGGGKHTQTAMKI